LVKMLLNVKYVF